MKITPLLLCAVSLLVALGIAAARPTFAASEEAAPPGPTPFTLTIMGTRHYADVDVVQRNVARIPLMQRFAQTVASQNHLQFAGVFGGSAEALIADIQGLAAERFDVQTRNDKTRGLVITLRKIQAQAP